MDLLKYYNKGLNYEDYHHEVVSRLNQLEKEGDKDGFGQYYKMNLKRIERLDKTFELSEEQKDQLKDLPKDFKLLTISEGWCGDAAQSVPVVNVIMKEMGIENRIVFRDENPDLMDVYLTDGSRSIPIFVGINSEGKEAFRWGPRPEKGMEMLRKHKANPEEYNSDQFHQDLQVWYNKDKGNAIFNELTESIKKK